MPFLRYTVTGAAATAAHYLVLIALAEAFAMPPWTAAAAGACVGALVAYGGNRTVTFRSTRSHSSTLPRFFLVAAFNTILSAIVVWSGSALGWHYVVAQILATVLALATGYRLNRAWTFA